LEIGETNPRKTLAATTQVQRVLSGGRITLNEDVRESLNIKTGDYVILKILRGMVQVIPADVSPRNQDDKK
jgi:bifunctional DNA-binding transcriptional regulator/antitoxin component of YhaV-PrlF toxin-antitoxin module